MKLSILIMIVAWVGVAIWLSIILMAERKRHPSQLFILFFTEMWERFSYYGMRSLLTLYMVNKLLYSDERSYYIYSAYGALVYAAPIIGGYMAERFIGYRASIIIGGVLMMIGHFSLAIPYEFFFFLGLAFLVVGNGFFKPNISSLVGELYKDKEEKKDSAFTIFYMGINVGAFLTPLTCGTIGQEYGWHYGFGLAGLGMLAGLITFLWNHSKFYGYGEPPLHLKQNLNVEVLKALVVSIIMVSIAYVLMYGKHEIQLLGDRKAKLLEVILWSVIIGTIGYMLFYGIKHGGKVRNRILALLILFACSTIFWMFFEQAGSSINLFTERNVDRRIFGWEIPASNFQGVNPLLIILLAPLFSSIWEYLGRRGLEPSIPVKFGLGIVQLGLGFVVLWWSKDFVDEEGLTPLIFLIGGYFLHTTGELCLSPVGLSTVTRLAPAGLVGVFMGGWFLSSSLAHFLGGLIASEAAVNRMQITMNVQISHAEQKVFEGVMEIPPRKGIVIIPGSFEVLKNGEVILKDEGGGGVLHGRGTGKVDYPSNKFSIILEEGVKQFDVLNVRYSYYDKFDSLKLYAETFGKIAIWAIGFGIFIILVSRWISKLME